MQLVLRRNVWRESIASCHFCHDPFFYGPGANHKHPSSLLCFLSPCSPSPAPLSTWNVLWHLWNGDPGVWQASPVETQRHEKESQALLAPRAACTYCTFIQIAHSNCNLDLDFLFLLLCLFPFPLLFRLFYSDIIKEVVKWTCFFFFVCFGFFSPASLTFWVEWVAQLRDKNLEHFPCSKMTKNGNGRKIKLFGLTALVCVHFFPLALLRVELLFFLSCLFPPNICSPLIPVELCKWQ